MQQLSNVHGGDDLRLCGIGKDEPGILGRDPRLQQAQIHLRGFIHQRLEPHFGLRVSLDGGRSDVRETILELDVALRLLIEASQAVAHQLMGEHTGYTVDGEGVAGMLQRREVTAGHDGGQH